MTRKPLAIASWKMAMTVAEGLAFIRDFQELACDLLDAVDVVICPPYTALWPLAQALRASNIQLGGQNIAPSNDPARTGEISAALLADVGCRWVMLGHWETRRHLGDDDEAVNHKVHLALEAGLKPILLIGEAHDEVSPLPTALERQLTGVLEGCDATQVATMVFVYEPERAIGVASPAPAEHVAEGCAFIRGWLRARWGNPVAEEVRIVYGGSVTPVHAANLLACPDVDGLGATRRGRDPIAFSEIVRQIARVKLHMEHESDTG